ncbi:craniofacial development protein 2-like [Octopus sinensis]|uniref:Craniofacial development protein 2-like n=1 Tax=Octopus sinensis TaxID=2607531 RepID=A0A6P7U6V9_9MOLL|nr:craniofacial development protein 2-like [Octopus sinensis]
MDKYRADIGCLQETKQKSGMDLTYGNYRMILLPSDCRHYGQGFVIHKRLGVKRWWRITDRISAIQVQIGGKGRPNAVATVINVYAPHSGRIVNAPEEIDEFYEVLTRTYLSLQSSTLLLVVGDWNAKTGIRRGTETFIGRHGRGYRNLPGALLANFCKTLGLFLCNTAFDHSARHKSTWTGRRRGEDGNYVPIYNQIDYIVCRQRDTWLLQDSRSYGGSVVDSDHKIVIGRFNLKKLYVLDKTNRQFPHKSDRYLSVVQKELKLRAENTKDMDSKLALKGRRAGIQKQIKTLNLQYGRDILASRLGELETLKDNAHSPCVIHRILHRHQLVSKILCHDLHQSLNIVIKTINKIKTRSKCDSFFRKFCKDAGKDFIRLLLHMESLKLMATKPPITPIIVKRPRDRYIADLPDLRRYSDINDSFSWVKPVNPQLIFDEINAREDSLENTANRPERYL